MKTKVIYCGLFSLFLLAGCQPTKSENSSVSQTTATTMTTMTSDTTSTGTSAKESSQSSTGNETNQVIKVSVTKAIELFQNKYPDAAVTSLELDSDWGSYFYKIEGADDKNEYEVKIDANTEDLEAQTPEKLDPDDSQKKEEDALDTTNLLSTEEAAQKAVEKVGGGTATDWDLDKDLGTTYWEVKVENGKQTTKVKLNSQTGEVLSTETED